MQTLVAQNTPVLRIPMRPFGKLRAVSEAERSRVPAAPGRRAAGWRHHG